MSGVLLGLNYMSCKYSMSRLKPITHEFMKSFEGKTAKEMADVTGYTFSSIYRAAKTFGVALKKASTTAPTVDDMKRYEGMTYKEIAAATGRSLSWVAGQMRRLGLAVKLERGKHAKPNAPRIQKADPPPKPRIEPAYETVGLPLSQLPPIKKLPPVPANEDPKLRLARLEAARKRFQKNGNSQVKEGK